MATAMATAAQMTGRAVKQTRRPRAYLLQSTNGWIESPRRWAWVLLK